MASKAGARVKITLRCSECKQRNYNTTKNKKNTPDRSGDEQVLPLLQKAHRSQRDEVMMAPHGLKERRVELNV